MAKQAETRFKEKVLAELKKIPGIWFVKTQERTTRGIPDILICACGHFIAWELKTMTGRLDKLQEYNLSQIRKAGGFSHVITPDILQFHLDALRHAIDTYSVSPLPAPRS